jgi:hypothetical protein
VLALLAEEPEPALLGEEALLALDTELSEEAELAVPAEDALD